MRQEWDARARKDAFYYIASWRKDWSASDFLKSGEQDYEHLVAPVLDRVGFFPAGKTMLELGCGAGRMTHSFSIHFDDVIAVDVSPEMLNRAKQLLSDVRNIKWKQANGANLGEILTGSIDFAFSYLVLQHLPNERHVHEYVRELLRVLNETGICLFQFNGMTDPTMNWRGRLIWRCIDALWVFHLAAISRSVARLLRLDPDMAGKSWHGVAMTARSVIAAVKASGGTVLEVSGDGTPMAWCCAKKTSRLVENGLTS